MVRFAPPPDSGDPLSPWELRTRLDRDFPLGDGVADTEAPAWCPYCGEPVEVSVDPGGGPRQSYVEDCPVCCRPWRVELRFGPDGGARVDLRAEDDL